MGATGVGAGAVRWLTPRRSRLWDDASVSLLRSGTMKVMTSTVIAVDRPRNIPRTAEISSAARAAGQEAHFCPATGPAVVELW